MIELLTSLSAALCEASVTMRDVAARIGAPEPRAGALAPLTVEPAHAGIHRAEVVGEGDDGPPAYIRLTLTADAGLTLADLQATFGRGAPVPRSRPDQGDRFQYHERPTGKPFVCTLIAETTAPGDPAVAGVTLRRDVRL